MATNTLTPVVSGAIILEGFWNDLQTAMEGDWVGRDTTGVPLAGQNLGTAAFPWGTLRSNALIINGSALDSSQITSPQNRIVSGKIRSTSNQPAFITPSGAGASFQVKALTTNLVYDVNGVAVTANTDITKGSVTLAPATQNTATVNDAAAAGQDDTRTWGESNHRAKNYITMTSAGTNITDLIGKFAAFKIAGTSTEYFLAFVESSTKLTHCLRGFFYDSTLAPVNRTKFSNGNTITLMKLGWVFIENDGVTVDVSYGNPQWSYTQPSGPATGDYWYDLQHQTWKRYDGASFVIINRTLIGMEISDATNTVGARCMDFYAQYRTDIFMDVEYLSATLFRAKHPESSISVRGNAIEFRNSLPTWDITASLAAGADMYDATAQNNRNYYFYVSDLGQTIISDIEPYYRGDLRGFYHPHNPWRCVSAARTNGSAQWDSAAPASSQMRNVQPRTEFDVVVGSPAQVFNGDADFSSIQSAHDAMTANQVMKILPGTFAENPVFTKALGVVGSGRGTLISGTWAFNSGSSNGFVTRLKFGDNVTVNSAVTGLYIDAVWVATGKTITDGAAPQNNYIVAMQE